jgi:hypothetical protein
MLDSAPPSAHLHPREVPWRHAFAWYEEAMRLFRFAPLTFIGLAFFTIATELLLKSAPGAFAFAGEIFTRSSRAVSSMRRRPPTAAQRRRCCRRCSYSARAAARSPRSWRRAS